MSMWRHGPVHPGLGVRGSGFGGRGFGIRGQGFGARGSDSKAAAGSVGVAEATVRPRGFIPLLVQEGARGWSALVTCHSLATCHCSYDLQFAASDFGPRTSDSVSRHSSLLSHLMAFTTPGESPLRCRQDSRKVSHNHENVAVIKGRTTQPGHAVNLHMMPRGGNSEPNRRALARAKRRGPHKAEVRPTLALRRNRINASRASLPQM
jgi:hypothetical protein